MHKVGGIISPRGSACLSVCLQREPRKAAETTLWKWKRSIVSFRARTWQTVNLLWFNNLFIIYQAIVIDCAHVPSPPELSAHSNHSLETLIRLW